MMVHNNLAEPWKVTVVDTGLNTMTGGRVKRVKDYVGNEPFMLTYGDGVSDVNIKELLDFHKGNNKTVTMTAYNSGQRFGVLEVNSEGTVREFREKTKGDGNLINIGFMVCEPAFFDYLDDDATVLEKAPLERLVKDQQLAAYKHEGFWQCMDTLREKEQLEAMWNKGDARWKVW